MNRRAFVLGAAMVLMCNLVAVTLRSYAEAAFLATYTAQKLPWLLIANAGGFAIATFAYDFLTRRAHPRLVDVTLLVALLVVAASSPSLLHAGMPPIALVVALTGLSQVAGLALWNRVAASVAGRDARRMLPRAGAAVTLGGAIAGLGAGVLVVRFGVTTLPYVGAVGTAVVLFLVAAQDRALTAGGAPGATAPAGASEALAPVHVALLRVLIAVAILEGIVATVIDLQFVATLKARYHGDTLAAAVALFYGGTNGILFLLQVAAVPRILVTRSVPTTAAIHPILAIGLYLVFVAAPGFGILASTRTADQVLRLATSRTSQEIELSPLPPTPRARWKVLLRGGMWPLGATLAAITLLLVGPRAMQHPSHLAGVAIAIALVWFGIAQIGARRFQIALAAPLKIRTHRGEDLTQLDLATLERWSGAAGGDDARTAGLARAALARARVAPSDLAEHLRHDDARVRAALFAQLVQAPAPTLRAELRAAVAIEDDDRALSLGLAALALTGDASALARGRSRAGISPSVAAAVVSAERTLARGTADLDALVADLELLLARDAAWAVALIRVRAADLGDRLAPLLRSAIERPSHRAGALLALTRIGPAATLSLLDEALAAGDTAVRAAVATIDTEGAAHLATQLAQLSPLARTQLARALAGAPLGTTLVGALLADDDSEVAHAALRTALAVARGGATLPAAPIAAASTHALEALLAHLDARDAAAPWSPAARAELELAIRRCVARLMWATAVEAAAAGRDPATLAATARHLIGGREPDRKRALDVIQEHQAGRAAILAVLERWLRPPVPASDTADTLVALSLFDPWLAALGGGELAALEPHLVALRAPALFATMPGPALAALAARATERTLAGPLFAQGDAGDTMFVVVAGELVARRDGGTARAIPAGGVVGELAVLTRAPRAATITAGPAGAVVLEIDRDAFAAAARRAPELVLGLSATLAGWLAPERPDVLG